MVASPSALDREKINLVLNFGTQLKKIAFSVK